MAAAGALPRRRLGETGYELSVLGFGASPLGSVFGYQIDEDEGVAAVHLALELGVNFVDCSPFYGDTKAETVLGRALAAAPVERDAYVLATKVGRYGPEPKDFDYSAERVTRSVQESRKRLNVDRIDVIQCHDIEFVSLDQVWRETLPALNKLKKDGVVGAVGITGLPFKALQYVLDKAEPGSIDTVLSYCHSNMQDGTLEDVLAPAVKDKGIGLINASPLAMGLLTQGGPPDWHPAPAVVKDCCAKAAAHCTAKGADFARIALQHSLRNTAGASTLVGMCTRDIVRQNVAAATEAFATPPSAEDTALIGELEAILKPARNVSWPQGLPENN